MNKTVSKTRLTLAYFYLESNPQKNIPKLLNYIDCFDQKDNIASQIETIREVVEGKDNNWYRSILSIWSDIDTDVQKAFFLSFILNAYLLSDPKRDKAREKYGCNIPWAILLDPTSACSLKCTGCWADEYGNTLSMSYETLDSIIQQGKELCIYFFIYLGGEPLVRKKDIISLCEKHKDCEFLAFTNDTLIDEEFADEMLHAKNFVPAISIEGFKRATDSRRGPGTHQAVIRAMDILRQKKIIFDASLYHTQSNTEEIGSEEFIDFIIENRCLPWISGTMVNTQAAALPGGTSTCIST